MPSVYSPVILVVLDGWGHSKQMVGNAILNARKPNLTEIERNYPSLLLQASGLAVGMSWGEAGNSEVGHLTIGAGKIILQYLTRINKDIESGYFFQNKELLGAIAHAQNNKSTLHLIGLLGSGSVHSYFNHILALLELIKRNNIDNYQLHLFTDGKDSALQEAPSLVRKIEEYYPGSILHIATLVGRDYAMDRNNRWDLTQKAYELWTDSVGEVGQDIFDTLEKNYQSNLNDSNLPPTVFNPQGKIKGGDSLIFFNFREDSMRQSIRVFSEENFEAFSRKIPDNIRMTMFTPYTESTNIFVVYPAPYISNGLAETLSLNGKNQLHIAETEKYAHVTYFFNCLKNKPFNGETDLFIPSLPDPTEKPEMQADEIVNRVLGELDRKYYDFIVINFANADILAHLGNLEKTIQGVESIDSAVGRLKDAVLSRNGVLLITADHGNAERVTYKSTGDRQTKHDQNPVPFFLVGNDFKKENSITPDEDVSGLLSDVAPTILDLMGLETPPEMNGQSLLNNLKAA